MLLRNNTRVMDGAKRPAEAMPKHRNKVASVNTQDGDREDLPQISNKSRESLGNGIDWGKTHERAVLEVEEAIAALRTRKDEKTGYFAYRGNSLD